MQIDKIPPLSADLIQLLHEAYPERTPDPTGDPQRLAEMWFEAGKRDLVRFLKRKIESAESVQQALTEDQISV